MNDRPDRSELNPDVSGVDESGDRPLPTGDLAASMPDWLRRPPAWRGLEYREERLSRSTVELSSEDRSPIDPSELIDDGDIPEWLRRVTRETPAVDVEPESPATTSMRPVPRPELRERTDPPPGTAEEIVSPVHQPEELAIWQQWPVVALLAVALAIAVVIAVLAVAL
jgi:hypothetical protein